MNEWICNIKKHAVILHFAAHAIDVWPFPFVCFVLIVLSEIKNSS